MINIYLIHRDISFFSLTYPQYDGAFMSFNPNKMTFFDFLTPLVASGEKTITIRDKAESGYIVGSDVQVFSLETDKKITDIRILAIEKIHFSQINEYHAKQEALELTELKNLIAKVYPDEQDLFVIHFSLMNKIENENIKYTQGT